MTRSIVPQRVIDQSVQFLACQRNPLSFIRVGRDQRFGMRGSRRAQPRACPQRQQLSDVATRKQILLAEQLGHERDACDMLRRLHSPEGREQIRSVGDYSMIAHQNRVVAVHEGLQRGGKRRCAGHRIWRNGNCAEGKNRFAKKRLVE